MTRTRSRRQLLRAAVLALAGIGVSACVTPPPRTRTSTRAVDMGVFRALSRLTYGPRTDELAHAQTIGLSAWFEEQLAPDRIDDRHTELALMRFDTLTLAPTDIRDLAGGLFDDVDQDLPVRELRSATLYRQLFSRRQLYETLVEFWSDHFNIYAPKGACWYLKTIDDRTVIRPHALGNFGALLLASARSPAMLEYLDNQSNNAGMPNENYARELLELHTLGVDAGYTQHDVLELARCLTGWRYETRDWPAQHGDFVFDAQAHDPGDKRILGICIAAGGPREVEDVLAHLATHPATASRLARKLARRLLGDGVSPALIDAAADAFRKSQGGIRALLRPLLFDGLARNPAALPPRAKRPLNIVTSALRALDAASDASAALLDVLNRMGQPAFGWPMPDGYPDHDEAWSHVLAPVWQFALALAEGALTGTHIDFAAFERAPDGPLNALSTRLLGGPLTNPARDALRDALGGEADAPLIAAALIASPSFRYT